jgi:L-methionine (R)-S-oxide reductase
MTGSDEIAIQVRKLAESGLDRDQLLRGAVLLLKECRDYYDWVGIYLLEGEMLKLHNYIGKHTEHTEIPVGKGICGSAVADRENKIVGDVTAVDNYLACSVETRSELVVLIRRGDVILGQIDADSDLPDAFTAADEELMESVAEVLALNLD